MLGTDDSHWSYCADLIRALLCLVFTPQKLSLFSKGLQLQPEFGGQLGPAGGANLSLSRPGPRRPFLFSSPATTSGATAAFYLRGGLNYYSPSCGEREGSVRQIQGNGLHVIKSRPQRFWAPQQAGLQPNKKRFTYLSLYAVGPGVSHRVNGVGGEEHRFSRHDSRGWDGSAITHANATVVIFRFQQLYVYAFWFSPFSHAVF